MSFVDNPSFAPEYSRDEHGWILFPSDADYRKRMFPAEVNRHAAKANVFLIQACIEFVSKPGEMLLDPMGGTGTLLVGGLVSRRVTLIEISPAFHALQKQAIEQMEEIAPGVSTVFTLLNAPLQNILPLPEYADHIIFSPPYASIMKSKGTDKLTTEKTDYEMAEYTFTSPLNIGLMNDFIWAQEMRKVYKRCFDTLKPGGTITVIVKDHMEKRQRVELSMSAWRRCLEVGFAAHSWVKWKAPGSVYTHIYRARGWEVVDDEDILILQKPIIYPDNSEKIELATAGMRGAS